MKYGDYVRYFNSAVGTEEKIQEWLETIIYYEDRIHSTDGFDLTYDDIMHCNNELILAIISFIPLDELLHARLSNNKSVKHALEKSFHNYMHYRYEKYLDEMAEKARKNRTKEGD